MSRMSENVGASTSRNPKSFHGLLQGKLYLTLPYRRELADHSRRAVEGMKYLCTLERWDCGFEFHSRHGCLCAFILCWCFLRVGSGLATG
jgi:hypothetical protein